MAAWEEAQAAQEAHDDDAELEAAAGCEPAHARTARLSPWAARLWRTRPMVEARTYDGKPLVEHHLFDRHGAVDLVAKEKDRASKRLRSDGAGPPPAREAAIRGDNARRASSHGAASATAATCLSCHLALKLNWTGVSASSSGITVTRISPNPRRRPHRPRVHHRALHRKH